MVIPTTCQKVHSDTEELDTLLLWNLNRDLRARKIITFNWSADDDKKYEHAEIISHPLDSHAVIVEPQ